MARRHLGSTYRLQLNGLGFAAATALVPFLDGLGVETCYLSPVTRAAAGSTHGYDVVDPTELDPALGTAAELEGLLTALDDRGMGALLDIVPNHMSTAPDGRVFGDVLRHGQASSYAQWFDIAWDEQDGKVLLPVLGDPLAEVLARGELTVDGEWLTYFDHRFPLAPGSGDGDLAGVVARQHYRLADWRVAAESVNYRRFFDINGLIGVRQEDPEVFAASHTLLLTLLADPRVRGVRVDHIDGLRDPGGYFAMLREATTGLEPAPVILVEKILEVGERLPDWPVEGTTGYEVASAIVGLFIDGDGAAELRDAAAGTTGDRRTFAQRAVEAKRRVIDTLLPHQRDQVARLLQQQHPADSELALSVAVTELTACLGPYRTYRQPDVPARGSDVEAVHTAAERAAQGHPVEVAAAVDGIAALVTAEVPADSVAWAATARWQQLSGPATAKGVEDTAMYDSGQLLAGCDVGSDPDHPAVPVAGFHTAMRERSRLEPGALSSTSTHDSKRSHDVRCRIAVLSEIAPQWTAAVAALDTALAETDELPDAADRRYLYETAVGAWPLDGMVTPQLVARLAAYAVKAAREAKRHSSWTEPDEAYEQALTDLVDRLCDEAGDAVGIIDAVAAAVAVAGATNAVASVLLKATLPGVPDTYQGDDRWFQVLVDPDNRQPLAAAAHASSLAALPHVAGPDLLASWRDGRLKQHVLRAALRARRRSPVLFAEGGYDDVPASGPRADHIVAFSRHHGADRVVVVVPRLVQTLTGAGAFPVAGECWVDTAITVPPGSYRDLLTGATLTVPAAGSVAVADVLDVLPVGLLLAEPREKWV